MKILKPSEWVASKVRLPDNTAKQGKYDPNFAPYQAPLLDAIGDDKNHRVVIMSSAQIGKTFILQATVGFYMVYKPRPLLILQPNNKKVKDFVKRKLRPFIKCNPDLYKLTGRLTGNNTENEMTYIAYPSGFIAVAGTETASDLASDSVGLLLGDEVDRMSDDAGGEGDPLMLARERGNSFWDFKEVLTSTPVDAITSKINKEYLQGTQERWLTPCPSCGKVSEYIWERFDIDTLTMACPHCGSNHKEWEWKRQGGGYVVGYDEGEKGVRSFHLSAFNSAFLSWERIARKWREAQNEGLKGEKVFFNTTLGVPWSPPGEEIDPEGLEARCEPYTHDCPEGVLLLTAGVDVQGDRLEVEIVGWGVGLESWSIRYEVIDGNPTHPDTWKALDEVLNQRYTHPSGLMLKVARTFVDKGYLPRVVEDYVGNCDRRRGIAAINGRSGSRPLVAKPQEKQRGSRPSSPVETFIVGTDEGKLHVCSYLNIQEVGRGYCHFKLGMNDSTYFKQLTAEKRVRQDTVKGTIYVWQKKHSSVRNEALDCRVYALAALHDCDPNWQALIAEQQKAVSKLKRLEGETEAKAQPKQESLPELTSLTPTLSLRERELERKRVAPPLPPPKPLTAEEILSKPLQRRPLRFGGR